MKTLFSLMIGLAVLAPGAAFADRKIDMGKNVLVASFDKTDLKEKEPYPVFANLLIDKNEKARLSYGGGAVSEFSHKLTPAESQKLRALLKKYGRFLNPKEEGKVRVFFGNGTAAVDEKAQAEIADFGLELTKAILKENR
ncbi:MAG: hypothetical protein HKN23_13525 [Verrucomicrobiales bacterium]|nr:hypothetical protein [Verrucomicrobiales bacterium]